MGLEEFARGSFGAAEVALGVYSGLLFKFERHEPADHFCRQEPMAARFEEGCEFEFRGSVGWLCLCGGHSCS